MRDDPVTAGDRSRGHSFRRRPRSRKGRNRKSQAHLYQFPGSAAGAAYDV